MSEESRFVLDPHLLTKAQEVIQDMISTVLSGKATQVNELTLEMVIRWFVSQKMIHARAAFGVLYGSQDAFRKLPRYYQGLFDNQHKCLVARQLVPDKIDPELDALFENDDLLVFSSKPL